MDNYTQNDKDKDRQDVKEAGTYYWCFRTIAFDVVFFSFGYFLFI